MALNENPNPDEKQRMIDDALREMGFSDNKENPHEKRFYQMHKNVESFFKRQLIASPHVHFDRNNLARQILPLYRDELNKLGKDVLVEMLASYYALRMANRL